MRYAHTAVHVYPRPAGLHGTEGAIQLALGLAQALVFVAVLWMIGAAVGELL